MPATRTYTSDFREHFAQAEQQLLRRRFMWFSGVLGALGTAVVLLLVVAFFVKAAGSDSLFAPSVAARTSGAVVSSGKVLVTLGVSTTFYVATFFYAWLAKPSDRLMLSLSLGLVIADGLLNIAVRAFDIYPFGGVAAFMITHIIACAVLPWRLSQATLSAAVVIGVSGVSLGFERGFTLSTGFAAAFSLICGVPGTLIAWARHSARLKGQQFRFLQQRYGQVRRELTDARRIHEAMFPVPRLSGPVRFTYRYQPMSVIGGDFLHVDAGADGSDAMSVVLLDVTGHGIPAALTVNRLYGELERLFAEDPSIAPCAVLQQLNRYVHLTMSEHSVFVTGLCVRADAGSGVLEYANAGHPPAFLVTADERIERLDSTGMVLGVRPDTDEDSGPVTARFEPGDRLIAYTDGATEARGPSGEMLRISGLERVLASAGQVAEGSWPVRVLEAINVHRSGPPEDDTLVIELYRPVGATSA
ncbi:MAG: PP2C family protein-serine/threonine phosphatase [Planctomycetota bacterium]